jgi:hypothetical protein
MDYLDKFRKKPAPKKQKAVRVAVPKSDVEINVKIVDRRKDLEVNRAELLKGIIPVKIDKGKSKMKEIAPAVMPDSIPTIETSSETREQGGPAEEQQEIIIKPKPKKRKPRKKKKEIDIPSIALDETTIKGMLIGDTIVSEREGSHPVEVVKYSSYYLNNRQVFIDSIASMFDDYRQELLEEETKEPSCDRESSDFSLLIHQKIIRDYINVFSPYRGLLLYHGLGSGKTCSSIAIAEGLKTSRQLFVMTPASLQMNYIKELKFCGDYLYKKNQFWEFISTEPNSETAQVLSAVLNLKIEYINKNKGAWMINVKKEPNFQLLDTASKKSLDDQLNMMIHSKYKFINYNGMRKDSLEVLKSEYGANPFNNKVIIIDEAHNFVSRIVNKLNRKKSLSYELYELIKEAQNCKIIFLTGTPIINYPNEIAVLFNMLRGYVYTFKFPITVTTAKKINEQQIKKIILSELGVIDTVSYVVSKKELVVTRNPYGFINTFDKTLYRGVTLDETGNISNEQFVELIVAVLKKNDIQVNTGGVTVTAFPMLPDNLDDFRAQFVKESGEMFNTDKFKRRIVGLTSYFRSATESLMPRYDNEKNFHIVRTEMSDYQFGIYEEARINERKLEKSSRKKKATKSKDGDVYSNSISTYRIFSRAFCNFVFPREIGRPFPKEGEEIGDVPADIDEDLLDNTSAEQRVNNTDGRYTLDEIGELEKQQTETTDLSYDQRIVEAMELLWKNKDQYLSVEGLKILSPKFVELLSNLSNRANVGNHLIYSQFRTIEGIGVIRLVLLNNGFAEFKIKNTGGVWNIEQSPEDEGKPRFVLYTGTESVEEKEIVRNIFNGKWESIPTNLRDEIQETAADNKYGEIIKVFMITAAGAEGIDLKNVRYVHLIEPYWHPVRLEQVIGRARRICSHDQLPEALRTVDVFLYLMTFTEKQMNDDSSIELRLNDKSKIDKTTPLTSDEALNEISNIKNDINKQLLHNVKETAIDCSVHLKGRKGNTENIKCYSFTTSDTNKLSYTPDISKEESDVVGKVNKKKITWKAKLVNIQGTKYAFRADTNEVFDLLSYKAAVKGDGDPTKIGDLIKKPDGKMALKKV